MDSSASGSVDWAKLMEEAALSDSDLLCEATDTSHTDNLDLFLKPAVKKSISSHSLNSSSHSPSSGDDSLSSGMSSDQLDNSEVSKEPEELQHNIFTIDQLDISHEDKMAATDTVDKPPLKVAATDTVDDPLSSQGGSAESAVMDYSYSEDFLSEEVASESSCSTSDDGLECSECSEGQSSTVHSSIASCPRLSPPNVAERSSPPVLAGVLGDLVASQLLLVRHSVAQSRAQLEHWREATNRGYHYTTLEDTKAYIERNKPKVLTMKEARERIRKHNSA